MKALTEAIIRCEKNFAKLEDSKILFKSEILSIISEIHGDFKLMQILRFDCPVCSFNGNLNIICEEESK